MASYSINKLSLSIIDIHIINVGTVSAVDQKIIVDAAPVPTLAATDSVYAATAVGCAVKTTHCLAILAGNFNK